MSNYYSDLLDFCSLSRRKLNASQIVLLSDL